jgi:TetR/AcrR family tetracycline transcriptional repressor
MPRQVFDSSAATGSARRRGTHAGLDLDQIVDAASRLDPTTLTMRAVAAELGVDHKALNHHVRDRDTLMGLLAWRAFTVRYTPTALSDAGWREACRAFANNFVDAAIPVGSLNDYLNLRNSPTAVVIEQVDILLGTLVDAGFSDEVALRLVTLLSTICTAHAQDVSAAESDARPRREIVQRVLDDTSGPALPNLARILPQQIDTYGHRQLEVSLDLFVAGAESLRN